MKCRLLTACESHPATTDFRGALIRAPIEHSAGHSRGFYMLLLLGLWKQSSCSVSLESTGTMRITFALPVPSVFLC